MIRFLFILLMSLFCYNAHAQGRIEIKPSAFDFGTIAEDGGTVSHTFKMINNSNSPVVILKAEVSCTCTKITFPKKPVKQNEETEITVSYNPKKQKGSFLKAITIYTNIPEQRSVITIKGIVK